jgi:hypothetical protein
MVATEPLLCWVGRWWVSHLNAGSPADCGSVGSCSLRTEHTGGSGGSSAMYLQYNDTYVQNTTSTYCRFEHFSYSLVFSLSCPSFFSSFPRTLVYPVHYPDYFCY